MIKDEQLELIRLTEQNLLGSLFLCGCNSETAPLETVERIVTAEDFLPSFRMGLHRHIYQAMVECGRTDQLTVAQAMFDAGVLQKGDIAYMVAATANILGIDYEHYAKLVVDNARAWRADKGAKLKFKGGI